MGNLSDIVNVNVSANSAAVTQPGFGIPLIADYHTRFTERIRFYSGPDGMISDGFTVNDAAYKAAAKVFAQTPQVQSLAIGRRALAPTLSIDVTPTAVSLHTYLIDVMTPAGVAGTLSYTSDSDATVAEICTGLKAAFDLITLTGLTCTNNSSKITFAAAAGLWFRVSPSASDLANMLVKQVQTNPGIETDLAAIKLADNTWYGLTMTTGSDAEIVAAAAWAESNSKQAFFDSQATDCIGSGSGDVGTSLKNSNEFRSTVCYHPDNATFMGAAVLGSAYPQLPGSVTFKFLRLASVATVPLTDTQLTNIRAKNIMSVTTFGGIAITLEGKDAAGEFCDVIRDRDWYSSRCQVRYYTLMLNGKVQFTDKGIALFQAELEAQGVEGVAAGFLAESPAPKVTVPLASSISPTDKSTRTLNGIVQTATIAGAIHAVNLRVNLVP